MRLSDLKVYGKFLSRNKLYTFVSVLGFSISLMFVITLSIYIKEQLSVDDFQEKKNHIFLAAHNIGSNLGNPAADFIKDHCPEVESYTRIVTRKAAIGQKGTEKVYADALFADSTFFTIFSFPLVEGNPTQVIESKGSAVVSRSFANKVSGNNTIVGKSIFIDNKEHTVTGIMEDFPENTLFPKTDVVVNYNSITNYWGNKILSNWGNSSFTMFFLEKEGADLPSKAPMLENLFKKDYWLFKQGFTKDLKFIPLKEIYFTDISYSMCDLKSNSKTLVTIYTAIAILILIIALLNYINLTVAQAAFRGKEAAMKKLLGCSRRTLMSQLLFESFLMTVFTFALGLFMALLAEPFFNDALSANLNITGQFSLVNILFVIAFILLICLIAGFIPAIVISGFNPIEVVKGTFARKVKTSYSRVLIIFQYAVSIGLLICSFFIQRQSDFLVNHDMGFDRDRILVMDNVLDTTQLDGFKAKILTIPGVENISFSQGVPTNGGNNNSFEKDGEQFSFQSFVVDSAFFSIYGIKVNPTGIPFNDKTFLLNQKGYNALHVDSTTNTTKLGWTQEVQIAGIVSDFNINSLHQPVDLVYISQLCKNDSPWDISVKIAAGADLFATADKLKNAYMEYNGGELFESGFVNDTVQQWYKQEEKMSAIMSAFTILTIVIMVMGVFAMSLYMIRQKEKEIGIRKVNGATEGEILIMLNKSSLIRVLIAFAIAVPISYYALNRWLENFAYKISLSWWVFVLSGLVVLLLTLISVSWQTWRAARANPVDSIKGE